MDQRNHQLQSTSEYFNHSKTLLNGSEHFTYNGIELFNTIKDYWAWAFSDLYNNIYRGILAEYIVATALHITPPEGNFLRVVWNPFDLLSKGGKRIEVKSAAYLQSWDGDFSKITFSIAPARTYVDDRGTAFNQEIQRNNDIYVFCIYTAKTRDISPLDLDYWEFYVLPTQTLNSQKPNQKSISLSSLQKLTPMHVKFDKLYDAIEMYSKSANT